MGVPVKPNILAFGKVSLSRIARAPYWLRWASSISMMMFSLVGSWCLGFLNFWMVVMMTWRLLVLISRRSSLVVLAQVT